MVSFYYIIWFQISVHFKNIAIQLQLATWNWFYGSIKIELLLLKQNMTAWVKQIILIFLVFYCRLSRENKKLANFHMVHFLWQIATVSPGMSCTENTLNTLRYADRYIKYHSGKNHAIFIGNFCNAASQLFSISNIFSYSRFGTWNNWYCFEELKSLDQMADHRRKITMVLSKRMKLVENKMRNIEMPNWQCYVRTV